MYPLKVTHLGFYDLATEWARDMPQKPEVEKVMNTLLGAYWLGDLEAGPPDAPNDDVPSRVRLLNGCSLIKYHPGIVFTDADYAKYSSEQSSVSLELPAGIRVAWNNTYTQNTPEFSAACLAMAKANFEDYADIVLPGLAAYVVEREKFRSLCLDSGWPLPTFWFAKGSTTSLSSAASQSRRWMMEEVAKGKKQMPKAGYLKACQQRFPGLAIKQFNRIWDKVVPDGWRRVGRFRKGQ